MFRRTLSILGLWLALLVAGPAYATLSTTSSTVTDLGNGVTTAFSYSFIIPAASDAVITYTPAGGTPVVLLPTQYTITGINNPVGGTVTYPLSGSPIAAGATLTISRIVPFIQTTSIANQGPTFKAIEGALDYLTMQTQQLANGNIGGGFVTIAGNPTVGHCVEFATASSIADAGAACGSGGGGGSGTVTSIATGTGLTGGTITTSGTLSLAAIANNRVLGNVSGGSAAPTALTGAQILTLTALISGTPATGHCVEWNSATTIGDFGAACGGGSGGGDVSGPGSSTNNDVAFWNGTSGTVLKDPAVASTDGTNFLTTNGGNLNSAGGMTVTGIAPVANSLTTNGFLVAQGNTQSETVREFGAIFGMNAVTGGTDQADAAGQKVTLYAGAVAGGTNAASSGPGPGSGEIWSLNTVMNILDGAGPSTTLAAAITSSGQTSISVASAANFPTTGTPVILIESEYMTVTAGLGTTTWTVTRGTNGTTATTHLINTVVTRPPAGAQGYELDVSNLTSHAPCGVGDSFAGLVSTPSCNGLNVSTLSNSTMTTGIAINSYNGSLNGPGFNRGLSFAGFNSYEDIVSYTTVPIGYRFGGTYTSYGIEFNGATISTGSAIHLANQGTSNAGIISAAKAGGGDASLIFLNGTDQVTLGGSADKVISIATNGVYDGSNRLAAFIGTPTTGNCVSWASATTIQDSGGTCAGGGGGSVSGPGSSTVNNFALWNNTGGTSLKDAGYGAAQFVAASSGTATSLTAANGVTFTGSPSIGINLNGITASTAGIQLPNQSTTNGGIINATKADGTCCLNVIYLNGSNQVTLGGSGVASVVSAVSLNASAGLTGTTGTFSGAIAGASCACGSISGSTAFFSSGISATTGNFSSSVQANGVVTPAISTASGNLAITPSGGTAQFNGAVTASAQVSGTFLNATQTGSSGGVLSNGVSLAYTDGSGNVELGGGAGNVGVGSGSNEVILQGSISILNGSVQMPNIGGSAGVDTLCWGNPGVTFAATCTASSIRYKEHVETLTGGLSEVLRFRPVAFDYKPEFRGKDPTKAQRQVGLIAEEVQAIDPRLVMRDEAGQPQGVLYENSVAVLIKAIQELAANQNRLESQIRQLKKARH